MMAPEVVLRIGGGMSAARRRSLAKLLSDVAVENSPILSLFRASLDGICLLGGGGAKLPKLAGFEHRLLLALLDVCPGFSAAGFEAVNTGANFLVEVTAALM